MIIPHHEKLCILNSYNFPVFCRKILDSLKHYTVCVVFNNLNFLLTRIIYFYILKSNIIKGIHFICNLFLGSRDTSLGWSSDSPIKSKSGDITNPEILGSAESLIEKVIFIILNFDIYCCLYCGHMLYIKDLCNFKMLKIIFLVILI